MSFDHDDDFPPEASKVRPLHAVKPAAIAAPKPQPIDWPSLAALEPPKRSWAQKGWFGFGHTTLLVGTGGIGKTLLAQQLASCLALGREFVAESEGQFKVLMWACEDDHDELWRRQISIARWMNVPLQDFSPNLVVVPRHGLDNALVSSEFGKLMFTPLLDQLKEQAADLEAAVVILDNVAQLYGANENDRHSVTVFLNALAGVLPGRAILLLAHPSRGAGSEFSGSSAWENTARTRLYLGSKLPGEKQEAEEPETDTVRYLARRKSNYSNRDWRKLNYRDGVLLPEPIDSAGGVVAEIRGRNAEKAIVDGLSKLLSMGLQPTSGSTSPRYLPRMLLEYKLADGLQKRELSVALRKLEVEGRILRKKVGTKDNRNPLFGLELA